LRRQKSRLRSCHNPNNRVSQRTDADTQCQHGNRAEGNKPIPVISDRRFHVTLTREPAYRFASTRLNSSVIRYQLTVQCARFSLQPRFSISWATAFSRAATRPRSGRQCSLWSEAVILAYRPDVRFISESRHCRARSLCPRCVNSGHQGSPASRRPSCSLFRSSGRRNGTQSFTSDTRIAGSISRKCAIAFCASGSRPTSALAAASSRIAAR
jgi:hypothetical protein